jgi:hypothetical protein
MDEEDRVPRFKGRIVVSGSEGTVVLSPDGSRVSSKTPQTIEGRQNMKHIVFTDINCIDSAGDVFERHNRVYMFKDIVRDRNHSPVMVNIYTVPAVMGVKGTYFPSAALMCNLLAQMYARKEEPVMQDILSTMSTYDGSAGMYALNTVNVRKAGKMIHYPCCEDMRMECVGQDFNRGMPRTVVAEDLALLSEDDADVDLGRLVRGSPEERFAKDFTGLEDPTILNSIGDYMFHRSVYDASGAEFTSVKIRLPSGDAGLTAAWLDFSGEGLKFSAYLHPDYMMGPAVHCKDA